MGLINPGRIDLIEETDALKVKTVKNVLSATMEFLIIGLNFKILFVIFVMIYRCFVLLLSLLKVLIIHDISKSQSIHLLENSVFDGWWYIQNAYQQDQY